MLLFHTGYFSISRKINSKIEFTWTNIETKQAFFETYNRDLKFNDKFLVSFCENLSKFALEDESEKQEIERFFENLQKFFLDIHQRYYQPEEIDHEHNFVFWFFFDVLTSNRQNHEERDYITYLIKSSKFKDEKIYKVYEIFLYYEEKKIEKLVFRKEILEKDQDGIYKSIQSVNERKKIEILK